MKSSNDRPVSARQYIRRTGAGRFVTGTLSLKGDSVRMYIELGDGRAQSVTLAKWRGVVGAADAGFDRVVMSVVDSLLLSGSPVECLLGSTGTRVLPAIRACDRAFSALKDGDQVRADSMFQLALSHDARYARAALWLAQSRNWLQQRPVYVAPYLTVALADTTRLTPREKRLLNASSLLAADRLPEACAAYSAAVAQDSLDAAAWLGLADCLRFDDTVIRQGGTWTFRTSYHRAIQAYVRAFHLAPRLMAAYRENSYKVLRDVFMTGATNARIGSLDSQQFNAYPAWKSDTLAFTPIPARSFAQGSTGSIPETFAEALDRQRDLVGTLSQVWIADAPASPDAHELNAVALELAGNRSSMQSIRRARDLATTAKDRARLAAAEVFLRFKFAVPDEESEVRAIATLSDSLLRSDAIANLEPSMAAAIALLLGRPSTAAKHARAAEPVGAPPVAIPQGAIEPARALLVFAAAGGPADSIVRLEREVDVGIRNGINPRARETATRYLLGQPALLGFSVKRLAYTTSHRQSGALSQAQSFWALHMRDSAANALTRIRRTRAGIRPADITIDGIYAEAALWAQLGDKATAAAILDASLNATRWYPPGRFSSFALTGAYVQAMILRVRLALEDGDLSTARKWAKPIALLWAKADKDMLQTYHEMTTLIQER